MCAPQCLALFMFKGIKGFKFSPEDILKTLGPRDQMSWEVGW